MTALCGTAPLAEDRSQQQYWGKDADQSVELGLGRGFVGFAQKPVLNETHVRVSASFSLFSVLLHSDYVVKDD